MKYDFTPFGHSLDDSYAIVGNALAIRGHARFDLLDIRHVLHSDKAVYALKEASASRLYFLTTAGSVVSVLFAPFVGFWSFTGYSIFVSILALWYMCVGKKGAVGVQLINGKKCIAATSSQDLSDIAFAKISKAKKESRIRFAN